MKFKTEELVQLDTEEIAAVTGAGEPINNPPGIVATQMALADGMPDNNPPG